MNSKMVNQLCLCMQMALGFQRPQDLWTEQARFEAQISEYPYLDYSHITVWSYFQLIFVSKLVSSLEYLTDYCLLLSFDNIHNVTCKTNAIVNIHVEVQVDQLKVTVYACACLLCRFFFCCCETFSSRKCRVNSGSTPDPFMDKSLKLLKLVCIQGNLVITCTIWNGMHIILISESRNGLHF